MDVEHLSHRLRRDRWVAVGARLGGVLLIAGALLIQPVAGQTGIDLLRNNFCSSQGAQLIAAAWAAGVIYYGGFGIFRGVTGTSKIGSSDPSEQTEGKERIKGAMWSFGAAILLLSAERILAFVGIPVFECVNLGIF